jgi:putative membrane protein
VFVNPLHRFNLILLTVYLLVWSIAAISPISRSTWWLENVLVFVALPGVLLLYRHMPFSRLSCTCLFLFFCLHAIGSHFTYSLVPYDDAVAWLTGTTINEQFGWERNHFDRLVHFLFGLLLTYPCRELFVRVAGVRGLWGYLCPLLLTSSFSALYELIEWWAAVAFGGDLGVHYLGTQGDVWDGQRDMALATLGALICMLIAMAVNRMWQRDFSVEWVESFRVKDPRPLGEEAIARMRQADESVRDPRW